MSFLSELKRRNVLRVGTAYIVSSWLLIQVAETIFPLFGFGDTPARLVVIVLAIAFIPSLISAWVFEITPEGLKRDADVDRAQSITSATGKKLDRIIIVILALALGYFSFDKFILDPARDVKIAQNAAQTGAEQALKEAREATFSYKSIAVLPFTNMSGEESNEPFTVGVHDDLLIHISKISDIKVISRTSVARLKTGMSIPDIGQLLRVATVLEGGVQRIGDRVRINAQLIDAADDQHLWAETYDRQLTAQNIFAIQSEIAAAITDKLRATLLPQEEENLNRVPTQNLQAYEAYLLGKQRMTTRTRTELLEADDYFEKAVELDPQYALAYVGLAEANLLLTYYGYVPLTEALAKAEPALTMALSLDDQLGATHASLGLSRVLQEDSVGAEDAFKRAIALDPNYATSYHWYGHVLMNSFGQPAAAIPLLEQARELDPLSPVIIITLGQALYGVGEIREAMTLYRKAVEIEPDYPSAYYLIGMAYLDLGDDAKAEYWIDRGISMWPEEFTPKQAKAILHRYRGEEAQALQVARQLLAIAPGNNVSLVTLVNYGQYQEALETIAPAYLELSCGDEPRITRNNLFQAINLSLALQETGERVCANRLLNKLLERMQEMPGQGFRSYGFLDAEIYARLGKTRQALDALRQAIDEGLRRSWWVQLEGSPHMVTLLEDPEFKAMMAEIRADMAAQLALVREMESNGELAPIPD